MKIREGKSILLKEDIEHETFTLDKMFVTPQTLSNVSM